MMKKNMIIKTFGIAMGLLLSTQPVSALLVDSTIITGKVKSYDTKNVILKAKNGTIYEVPLSQIDKKIKLSQAKEISVTLEITPSDLLMFNLPMQVKDLKKLKKEKLKMLVSSYQTFMLSIDAQMLLEQGYKEDHKAGEKVTWLLNQFLNIAQAQTQTAPASTPESTTCFYAGWPSTRTGTGNRCQYPWDPSVIATSGYERCGGTRVYRCNPVLYGPSAAVSETNLHTRSAPQGTEQKGICVEASGDPQVVERCTAASQANLNDIIQGIKTNPAAFNRFANSVAAFCSGRHSHQTTNTACGNLRERIASIEFGISSCDEATSSSFGVSAGTKGHCPGELCYVQANCRRTAGAAGTAAVPIVAVCPCSVARTGTGASATVQIEACIKDTSVASLAATEAPPAAPAEGGGPHSISR